MVMMITLLRRFMLLFANGWQRRLVPLLPQRQGEMMIMIITMVIMIMIMMLMMLIMMMMMISMITLCCRILYGGSVSAANCRELAACPDIDGKALSLS